MNSWASNHSKSSLRGLWSKERGDLRSNGVGERRSKGSSSCGGVERGRLGSSKGFGRAIVCNESRLLARLSCVRGGKRNMSPKLYGDDLPEGGNELAGEMIGDARLKNSVRFGE